METSANIFSCTVFFIWEKFQLGLAIMNFSYLTAILLAVTCLLSLLGEHVCSFTKVAICQLSVLEFFEHKHTQGQCLQSHAALTLVGSSLTYFTTFLSFKQYCIMASLNSFFPLNFPTQTWVLRHCNWTSYSVISSSLALHHCQSLPQSPHHLNQHTEYHIPHSV